MSGFNLAREGLNEPCFSVAHAYCSALYVTGAPLDVHGSVTTTDEESNMNSVIRPPDWNVLPARTLRHTVHMYPAADSRTDSQSPTPDHPAQAVRRAARRRTLRKTCQTLMDGRLEWTAVVTVGVSPLVEAEPLPCGDV